MELPFGSLAALVVVASLGGGAAGAWLTSSKKEPAPHPKKEIAKDEEVSGGDVADEADDRSDARLRSLEHRVTLLTSALSKLGTTPGAASGENQLLPENSDDVADPVFEAAVLDILERQQEQKATEREERRVQRTAQENDRKMSLFTERLGLNPNQVERVRATMMSYQKRMTELRNASPENRPNSRSAWRSKMDEFSSSVMTDLSGILSADQLKLYKSLASEDQIASGRGRNSANSHNSGSSDDSGSGNGNSNENSNRNRNTRNGENPATRGESEPAEVRTNH